MVDVNELMQYERQLQEQGYKYICGVDEVGRGPLAGPVCAAAVILPEGCVIDGINDSKKLTEKKRDFYYDEIMKQAISVGVGIVSNEEIDSLEISEDEQKNLQNQVQDLVNKYNKLIDDKTKEKENELMTV